MGATRLDVPAYLLLAPPAFSAALAVARCVATWKVTLSPVPGFRLLSCTNPRGMSDKYGLTQREQPKAYLISMGRHRENNPRGTSDKCGLTQRHKQLRFWEHCLWLDLSILACCLLLRGASSCCGLRRHLAQSSRRWQHQRAASAASEGKGQG